MPLVVEARTWDSERPGEVLAQIAVHMRALRLGANLTQMGLAKRAGVSYASLRAFERTGRISLLSFVKLAQTLNKDGPLLAALEIVLLGLGGLGLVRLGEPTFGELEAHVADAVSWSAAYVLGESLVEDEEIRIEGAGLPPTGITPFW